MPVVQCGFKDIAGGVSGRNLLVGYGPTVVVDIGFDQRAETSLRAGPRRGSIRVHALVDTGATESCVDTNLAARLGFPVVDRQFVSGIGGRLEVSLYLAEIQVPGLGVTIYGPFAGVLLADGGQPHEALIGRSFLSSFTMVYDGKTGSVTISS